MPIDDAAKAKTLINVMMQDRFFLALYRSNDPKVRAVAMDKLNKAHIQAYGLSPSGSSRRLFYSHPPVHRRKS